jgi:predicted Zn-ribbon and HTH transcriptional regulator
MVALLFSWSTFETSLVLALVQLGHVKIALFSWLTKTVCAIFKPLGAKSLSYYPKECKSCGFAFFRESTAFALRLMDPIHAQTLNFEL